jgi:WD40 repeat protein
VWSVAISVDNKFIVSGSQDKTIRVWDIESIEKGSIERCFELLKIEGHKDEVYSVAIS